MIKWPRCELFTDWQDWARRLLAALDDLSQAGAGELQDYRKSKLPSPSKAQRTLIYVPDAAGGAVPAYSDGTTWRRVTDGSEID